MIDLFYRILGSLGYHHPVHIMFTHIPVGLVVGAFIFFLVAIIFARKSLILTARHASILAFIFVFPTILFGVFDWLHFYNGVLFPAIKAKMGLASGVLVILAAGIILGGEVRIGNAVMTVVYALAFLCAVGLGYFGAEVVGGPSTRQASAGQGDAVTLSAAAQSGEQVFALNCQSCHANGGNVIAPMYPLKSSKHLAGKADFIAFIRAPKMPDGKEGDMPPFDRTQVGDTEAGNLYEYVSSMVKTAWK
jgi:mono/diheme cytochrome c family protein